MPEAIPFTHFPPDTLTFHISGQLHGTRSEYVIRDSASILLSLRNEYMQLTPRQQRVWIVRHMTQELTK